MLLNLTKDYNVVRKLLTEESQTTCEILSDLMRLPGSFLRVTAEGNLLCCLSSKEIQMNIRKQDHYLNGLYLTLRDSKAYILCCDLKRVSEEAKQSWETLLIKVPSMSPQDLLTDGRKIYVKGDFWACADLPPIPDESRKQNYFNPFYSEYGRVEPFSRPMMVLPWVQHEQMFGLAKMLGFKECTMDRYDKQLWCEEQCTSYRYVAPSLFRFYDPENMLKRSKEEIETFNNLLMDQFPHSIAISTFLGKLRDVALAFISDKRKDKENYKRNLLALKPFCSLVMKQIDNTK